MMDDITFAEGGDAAPEVVETLLTCKTCNAPLEYSGKGRKPLYCSEHRKSGSKRQIRATSADNQKLAEQALAVLYSAHTAVALGLAVPKVGLPNTARAAMEANETFRETAFLALVSDPALCRQIIGAGGVSGKMMLGISYASWLLAVVPTAVIEIRERKASREDE